MKEVDNFLDDDLCDFFIAYIKNSKNKIKHRNTSVIECDKIAVQDNGVEFKILLSKLTFFVKKYFIDACINYSQITEWPTNEFQNSHIDFDHHSHTSVLYLNDDYEGGDTVVGDKVIVPKKGKIILFEGNKIEHKVLKIKSGTRYTNSTWYITPQRRVKTWKNLEKN